jgi:uncharacterized membrane protein
VSTNRLEAFSDGVIAVAITLLVLDIRVPAPDGGGTLAHRLAEQWPTYAAYATSFVTIGIIWINHHVMIGRLRETDHAILMLNVLLLMTVVLIPFATSLLASYLTKGHGQHVAAGVYGGVLLSMAMSFTLVNHHILMRKPHLLRSELPLELRRRVLSLSVSGLVPYVLATALAAVSPYATLAVAAAVAFYYALPIASGVQPGG